MTRFEVFPCGDPYSRAWDCCEVTDRGLVFRGDLSGAYRRDLLERILRDLYPGCEIKRVRR